MFKSLWSSLTRFCKRHDPNILPSIKAIFIAENAGDEPKSVNDIHAVSGRGLQGDRYFNHKGHWKATDSCQVTLITEQELQLACRRTTINLDNGAHRRNLVIAGIQLRDLEGKRFKVGKAVFEYNKRRPPCGYIDRVAGNGVGHALGKGSGACVNVIESGIIHVGDQLVILAQ